MESDIKTVAILGSTGTVGLNTIEIINANKSLFKVVLLSAAGMKPDLIKNQILQLQPKIVIINNDETRKNLENQFENIIFFKNEKNIEIDQKIDISIIGIAGIEATNSTIKFIQYSKTIAIANKASIICCWDIIKKEANKYNTKIIPVDSEHNSLYQLLQNKNIQTIEKYIITASGGPFWNQKVDWTKITARDVFHPNWKMGPKNTIDSATMVNKGLEIIEACKLFDIPSDKIEAIIHPQSIIHAIVQTQDGCSFSLLSTPDMKLHIANAMFEGQNYSNNCTKNINFLTCPDLTFAKIDENKFKAIYLAKEALKTSQEAIITFNAADEEAIDLFLTDKINFSQITNCIEYALENITNILSQNPSVEEILSFHYQVRKQVNLYINK